MKKILFTVAITAMVGLGLISCKKDGKCYHVTYSAAVGGIIGAEYSFYQWLTEEQIATQKAKYEAEGFTNITFTEASNYTKQAVCIGLGNLPVATGQCWKVSYNKTVGGVTTSGTLYIWCTKEKIDTEKASLEARGYTNVTFEEASSYTTVADCLAQNTESEE